MAVNKRVFGAMPDGKEVCCWTLTNAYGLQAEILDYGVTVRTLIVPDKNGKPVDVVLGYDTLDEYRNHSDYLGATIGRFANRIGNATFHLNGKEYKLAANNGKNHLHGGDAGFDKRIWNAEPGENCVVFSLTSPDAEEGYPGTLQVQLTLTLTNDSLLFHYRAVSDQDTILNLTNHSYFNLDGAGNVLEHLLTVNANAFAENDANCLPTGRLLPVGGTAFDFRTEKPIGKGDCVVGGYDNNMILGGNPAAVVRSEKSGIVMTVTTDQPGMQLYTANQLSERIGKNGAKYEKSSGLCLETQHYPDAIHHPQWPTCILRAGEVFESTTGYSFGIQ